MRASWNNPALTRRAAVRDLALVGLGAALAGCGTATPTAAPPAKPTESPRLGGAPASTPAVGGQVTANQPKKGGALRWGVESDVATLDPVWTTATVTINLALNLYDTLFAYDAKLTPQPVLVKDYTVSPDKLAYTFNLREDATFDGGRPLTSGDVVASIARWGKRAPAGVSLFTAVNSLQAKGEHTFVLEMKEPYGLVVDSLAAGGGGPVIMSKDAASTPPDQRVDDVTASGPFRLAEWTKGSKIVLKPRADYKGPAGPVSNLAGARAVYLDALEIPIIPDDTSRLAALQAGTIDVMTASPTDYFDQLKGNPGLAVKTRDWGYNVISFNHARPPFANPLARQAVQAAIDVDKIMTAGWGRSWKPCPAIFMCGTANESQAGADQYNQKNLSKARQLFQQLVESGGYDGRPVVLLGNTTYTWALNGSQVVKQTLEAIGFKVDLQTPDFATAVSLRPSKDKWDLFYTGGVNGAGANDPLRSVPLSPAQFGWYNSPEMQELQRQYARATTSEQQRILIDKVQAQYYKDVPVVLLGIQQPFDAHRTYVKGYSNYPNYASFWNVWLDK